METYIDRTIDLVLSYAPDLIIALLILWVGLRLIKFIEKLLTRVFEKRNFDPTLQSFLSNLISWSLRIMLIITVVSMLGVPTTSFIAVLGAAGLAIGLALQGSLANFAGGILILMFRPFKLGDKIKSQGNVGVVQEIQILFTILSSANNETVILPNAVVMNSEIINYTTLGKIRVDLPIGISYDADIAKAKQVILETLSRDPKILQDPSPSVGVNQLADSAVNLMVMPWCEPQNYWAVHFNSLEQCKVALDQAGVQIPFPQLDVHLTDKLDQGE
ncbi:MAG: mechanosensitive ion channel family protein [Cyclobacteriaceae bacterium]